jgi:hypothetical protein
MSTRRKPSDSRLRGLIRLRVEVAAARAIVAEDWALADCYWAGLGRETNGVVREVAKISLAALEDYILGLRCEFDEHPEHLDTLRFVLEAVRHVARVLRMDPEPVNDARLQAALTLDQAWNLVAALIHAEIGVRAVDEAQKREARERQKI